MKFLDPITDFAFKRIFGSEDTKDILIRFPESLQRLHGDKKNQGHHHFESISFPPNKSAVMIEKLRLRNDSGTGNIHIPLFI